MDAPENDWMEWQAGYVCGALLMLASAVREWVQEFAVRSDIKPPFAAESTSGLELISMSGLELISIVSERCNVSDLAARIRLLKLGQLSES